MEWLQWSEVRRQQLWLGLRGRSMSTTTTSPLSLTRKGSPGWGRVPSPGCTHTVTSPTSIPLWTPSSGRWGWVCSQGSREPEAGAGLCSLPSTRHWDPCAPAGLPRRDPRANSQGGAQESHSAREGAATGWTRGHCPLCPHSLLQGVAPGQDTAAGLLVCTHTSDPSDPRAQGVHTVPAPLGTHRHTGDRDSTEPHPILWPAQLLLSNKLRPRCGGDSSVRPLLVADVSWFCPCLIVFPCLVFLPLSHCFVLILLLSHCFTHCLTVFPLSHCFTHCLIVFPLSHCFTLVSLFNPCLIVLPTVSLFYPCLIVLPIVSLFYPCLIVLPIVSLFYPCLIVLPLSHCFTLVSLFSPCLIVLPLSHCFPLVSLFHPCLIVLPTVSLFYPCLIVLSLSHSWKEGLDVDS
ncbi:uncharacterized protein GJ701_012448 [Geothlypis trichas]